MAVEEFIEGGEAGIGGHASNVASR
jgi:hypothetical protein